MKITYRIPTKDQYAFVEVVEDTVDTDLPASRVREVYDNLINQFKDGSGLSTKQFNEFIDAYLSTGNPPEGGLELWEQMSKEQKVIINECKKALQRINK